MTSTIIYIIIGIIALIMGIVLGKIIFSKNTKKQLEEADEQAQKIIADAKIQSETLKKEKQLEAKEHFVQLKSEHDKEVFQRNQKLSEAENRVKQKEQSLHQKEQNFDKLVKENDAIKDTLNRQIEVVNIKRTELEKHQEEHIRRLEKVSGLTAEEAKGQLIESLKHEAHSQA
ncbi:MAG: Rnase Y domain-containing protein, partial [Ginsengibacter sp.]